MMTDIFSKYYPSASSFNPSLHHLPYSPSLTSLVRSEEETPIYVPSLVQDPSVIDLPTDSQPDIIIVYVDLTFKVCIQNSNYYSVMGPSGAGKSAVSFLHLILLNVIH